MKEARFYTKQNGNVKCYLCRHNCLIAPDKRGRCGVRLNKDGKLYTLVYGKAVSYHVDPIEKKPLYHFLPKSQSFSFATVGCNFSCLHCQNWEISQHKSGEPPGVELPPKEIVRLAEEYNCSSISYTYTEPTVFYEYTYDTAELAHRHGIKNVFVTNGYIGEEALREISKYMDAANIDLKGFTEEFYRKICGARLEPVLENIRLYHELGIWIEVTTLVIPGYNDSEEQLRGIARFLADLDPEIPWHVTRFHPDYQLTTAEATPVETLRKARQIGLEEGLQFVYIGNVLGEGENTYCNRCGSLLIKRFGYDVDIVNLKDSRCAECGNKIPGVFE